MAVGLLAGVLVIGGLVVGVSVMRGGKSGGAGGGSGVVRNNAVSIEAGMDAAAVYMRDKKYGEAGAILEKLAEMSPVDVGVRVAYAQALVGQQKWGEALEQYEAAVAASNGASGGAQPGGGGSGGGADGKVARDPAKAQLHFEAGTAANMAGRADVAERYYKMAQMLDPAESRYPLFLAMIQIKTGDDAAANASLLRAVKMNPELAEAWGTMAELAVKQNRLGLASQHIEKARQLQPEVGRWRIVEARILNREGNPEKAATMLMSLDPSVRMQKDVLELLGQSYGFMNKPGEAAKMYEEAAKAQPTDAELHYQAALWYGRAGERAKSAEQAKTAAMLGHADAKAMVGAEK